MSKLQVYLRLLLILMSCFAFGQERLVSDKEKQQLPGKNIPSQYFPVPEKEFHEIAGILYNMKPFNPVEIGQIGQIVERKKEIVEKEIIETPGLEELQQPPLLGIPNLFNPHNVGNTEMHPVEDPPISSQPMIDEVEQMQMIPGVTSPPKLELVQMLPVLNPPIFMMPIDAAASLNEEEKNRIETMQMMPTKEEEMPQDNNIEVMQENKPSLEENKTDKQMEKNKVPITGTLIEQKENTPVKPLMKPIKEEQKINEEEMPSTPPKPTVSEEVYSLYNINRKPDYHMKRIFLSEEITKMNTERPLPMPLLFALNPYDKRFYKNPYSSNQFFFF